MKRPLAAILLAVALAAATSTGCAPRASFVKVDDVALGRVVVYRNGVAYYERRARVAGGKLTVNVPRDKVDDFLKSLTVVDAATGEALPVAFPRRQSDEGAYIEMTLDIPRKEPIDLILTYVTESPAWKPSYRIAMGEGGKVTMEGWAIVDNTSGEDWKDVTVGVGSSSALSFHYDLWSVRSVARATLATEDRFAVAPPSAVSGYGGPVDEAPTGDVVVATLDDREIRRPQGHPDAPRAPSATVATAERWDGDEEDAGGYGRAASAEPAPPQDPYYGQGDAKLKGVAPAVARSGDTVVVKAIGDANRPDAERRAKDRANLVRDQLIDSGVAPGQIVIETELASGASDAIALVQRPLSAEEKQHREAAGNPRNVTDADPVGESHFQSTQPMTVGQGTSVMVPMVRAETDGAQVYLYDAESERGNDRFAFKAIRITNPTDSTLETGPVTVYGDGRFIGEGLTEPIPPRASVVVPYALDRQVIIERDAGTEDRIARLVTLQRGVLTAEIQHVREQKLTLTSRLREATKVYVRHTVGKGWTLLDAPKAFERIGDAHLFEIELGPQATKTVVIRQATPLTRTLDLTANVTLDLMRAYVDAPDAPPALLASLRELLATHRSLVDAGDKLISLQRRLGDYRTRMDELHAQLLTLQAVKTGGDLMKHLRAKMKDISERVQQATIEQVDTQEQIMLARVRFQDQLAELHLPDATGVTVARRP